MKQHSWVIEEVDGGPVGTGEFFKCTECGCCGGWARGKPDHPFIPGPALPVSLDCDEAHAHIYQYVRGYLRAVKDAGIRPKLMGVFERADLFTPKEHPRVEFFQILQNATYKISNRWNEDTIQEVKTLLVGAGFHLKSRKCTQCAEPTDRLADDPEDLCWKCASKRTKTSPQT